MRGLALLLDTSAQRHARSRIIFWKRCQDPARDMQSVKSRPTVLNANKAPTYFIRGAGMAGEASRTQG